MYPQVSFQVSPFLSLLSFFKRDKSNGSNSKSPRSSLLKKITYSKLFCSLLSNSDAKSESSFFSSSTVACPDNSVFLPKSSPTVSSFSHFAVAFALFVLGLLLFSNKTSAQVTYGNLQILKVNSLITTVITAHEPIEIVDMSTDNIIGERTLDNTLMIKPINDEFKDGEFIATLTIITERYRVQYGLVYTEDITQAVSDKELFIHELTSFKNTDIKMSLQDMRDYATRIWFSPSNIRNISSSKNKMKIRLNNLYSVGDYFFLDFSIENKTNIPFDIDEIRIKLSDKKVAKSTNCQIIDLRPVMILKPERCFRKNYRNVLVIPKLTFPNDKILTLEISEEQISGRTLKLNIDYEDVLNADAFSKELLQQR